MPRMYSPRLPGPSTKGQVPINPFSGNKMKLTKSASLSEKLASMRKEAGPPLIKNSTLGKAIVGTGLIGTGVLGAGALIGGTNTAARLGESQNLRQSTRGLSYGMKSP